VQEEDVKYIKDMRRVEADVRPHSEEFYGTWDRRTSWTTQTSSWPTPPAASAVI